MVEVVILPLTDNLVSLHGALWEVVVAAPGLGRPSVGRGAHLAPLRHSGPKHFIALVTLGGVSAFGAVIWWLAKRLGEDFQHW